MSGLRILYDMVFSSFFFSGFFLQQLIALSLTQLLTDPVSQLVMP
jgi:hypothetical protein